MYTGNGSMFDRQDTKAIKGIALILMLMHHLWAFTERIFVSESFWDSFCVFGEIWYSYIGRFGKICVSMYLFLGGYGMMKSAENRKVDLIARLKGLYCEYWKVFAVFIPIAFLVFSKQPIYCARESICTRYADFSVQECLKNLLGVSSSYNPEWWFFQSYVVAILTFPFVVQIMKKHSAAGNVFWIVVWSILQMCVFPALATNETLGVPGNNALYSTFFCQTSPFISCFWMGILMAKDDLLVKTMEGLRENNLLNPIVDCIALLIILFARNNCYGAAMDILFAPAITVFASNLLSYMQSIKKMLVLIGSKSTFMWYIHSFFCYYFYPVTRMVVYTRNAVISLVTLILITYIAAWILEQFWNFVGRRIEARSQHTRLSI